ncbi:MAG: glycosyltransferase family 4 protein [bacterium]|nr:glycosyltransferase family 4 protein [bacterium]
MQVGIDITSTLFGRGVSRYTSNLVRALANIRELQLSLYGCSLRQQDELELIARQLLPDHQEKIFIEQLPGGIQNIAWNWLSVNPVKKHLPNLQVFHSWDWIQPPDADLALVSTIHDLAILKFPQTAHPQVVKMHSKSWKRLKERDAEIIAVSHATKKDIVELLEIPADKIHVVHEALPAEFKKSSDALTEDRHEQLKNKLHLTRPFILFVGTREPRKNLARLIEAWLPLKKDLDLIIAGESGWDTTGDKSYNSISELRFLGKVTDQELVVLYAEAEALAYPCLYEGFGLPILESFYLGTPVITSNVSSMLEVAGNAATLVDPMEVESIRAGILTTLNEPLQDQKQRLQRMIIRLQLFNWQSVAEETTKVYQTAWRKFSEK